MLALMSWRQYAKVCIYMGVIALLSLSLCVLIAFHTCLCDAAVIPPSCVPVSDHIARRVHCVPRVSPCIRLSIHVHQC